MLDLAGLDGPDPAALATGAPLLLPIDAIDEDPSQPRREFDPRKLEELAETIASRGVRTAISVRPHPVQPGRWIVNAGARRLRASRMAGRTEVPAFVDRTFDSYDQIIENEQREGLKPMELALFVQRELEKGTSKADIAKRLGKSGAYITYVSAMIDPPDWLIGAYRNGRCRGVKELYDLRRLHETNPEEVDRLIAEPFLLSRGVTANLLESRAAKAAKLKPEVPRHATIRREVAPRSLEFRPGSGERQANRAELDTASAGRPLNIEATVDDELVELVLDQVPEEEGHVFVRARQGDDRTAVPITSLRSLALRRTG